MKRFVKKEGLLVFIILISIFSISAESNNTVTTSLEIINSAPILLEAIPNQTWAANTALLLAFDLDDYFTDLENSTINYTYTTVDNISIAIDSSNNVSFYPDVGFIGNNTVIFKAFDGELTTFSNTVYLFVGTDNEPPQWSSPTKNRETIYQNTNVNFSTSWTDNIGLKSFTFSVNEGSWANYSGNFTGKSNVSIYRYQISSPSANIVYWKFCGLDTSDNLNCTDIQNFTVSDQPVSSSESPDSSSTSSGSGEEGSVTRYLDRIVTKEFTLDSSSFKLSLTQGSAETRILEITNIGSINLSFDLSVNGLEDLTILSENIFNISAGGKKKITLDFNADKNTPAGQYFGELIISTSSAGSVKIPIILDINPADLKFEIEVNISEEYKEVDYEEFVLANITIENIADKELTEVVLYTALKDLNGNIYDSNQESLELRSSLFLVRNFTIQEDLKEGEYLFYARVSNEETISIDSDFFEVGFRFQFAAYRPTFIFLIILLASVFAMILASHYRKIKEKERILSLYLILNELKRLVRKGKFDEAVNLYIKIKTSYGEPVSRSAIENKERLKEEIKILSSRLKTDAKKIENTKDAKTTSSPEENNANPKNENVKKIPSPSQKITNKKTPIQSEKTLEKSTNTDSIPEKEKTPDKEIKSPKINKEKTQAKKIIKNKEEVSNPSEDKINSNSSAKQETNADEKNEKVQ